MSDRLKKVTKDEIPSHGLYLGGPEHVAGGVVQVLGSRETFTYDGEGHWLSQNDDLGAKLDAIQAAAEAQLQEQRTMNEFLAIIVNALTG